MDNYNKESGFKSQKIIILPDDIIRQCAKSDMTKEAYVSDIGFFPNALYHFRERKNGCASHILIYCDSGEGFYSINHEERHTLKKGQLLIIPATFPHIYGSCKHEPWSIHWLHIQGESVSNSLNRLKNKSPINFSLDLSTKFIELFEETYNILEKGYTMDNLIYISKILEHMIGVVYYGTCFNISNHNKKTNRSIEKAIQYMNKNIYNKITLKDLSNITSFSAPHFSQLFKLSTGYSPIDYFLRLKIQHSCKYLDLTDISIKEVAAKFGFSDPYYYSRLFKKIMGKSPMIYKKTVKG